MTIELTLTIDKVCMESNYESDRREYVKKPMSHASAIMEDHLYCGLHLPGELALGTEVRVRIEVGAKEEPSRFDDPLQPAGRAFLDSKIAGIDEAVGKALQGIEEQSK